MRPGEPFNLKTEDIDLKTGDIFIRKSKRGKDRHIIVSDDMRDLCTVYNGLAGKREWFFQYPDGGQIPTRWAQWHFSKAWRKSTLFSRGNNPRPYDLRHNFATRTLMRWIDEGRGCYGAHAISQHLYGTCQLRRNPILYTPFAGKIKILARNRLEDAERYIPDRGGIWWRRLKIRLCLKKFVSF